MAAADRGLDEVGQRERAHQQVLLERTRRGGQRAGVVAAAELEHAEGVFHPCQPPALSLLPGGQGDVAGFRPGFGFAAAPRQHHEIPEGAVAVPRGLDRSALGEAGLGRFEGAGEHLGGPGVDERRGQRDQCTLAAGLPFQAAGQRVHPGVVAECSGQGNSRH